MIGIGTFSSYPSKKCLITEEMETKTANGNQCPVCGQHTKESESLIYCENCGFNINKKEKDLEPKAS